MQKAISMGASDVFLVAGLPVTFKCEGHQERLPDNIMKPPEIQAMVENIYELAHRNRGNLERGIDDDFSFAVWNLGRFRVNVFRQRGSLAAVIRVIHFFAVSPGWMVYNFLNHSLPGVFTETLNMLSVIVYWIRELLAKMKKTAESEK
jgi:Tfp pilus assembly pilus retraction ATPase PilT